MELHVRSRVSGSFQPHQQSREQVDKAFEQSWYACRFARPWSGLPLLIFLLGAVSNFAVADVIPDVQLDQRVLIGSNNTPDIEYHGLFANSPTNGVITYTGPSNVGIAGTMTVTAVISPSPAVTVSSNVPGEGDSFLTYAGEVVGPAGSLVPLDLTGTVSVNFTGAAENDIVIEVAGVALDANTLCGGSLELEGPVGGSLNQSCGFNLQAMVSPNTVFAIDVWAQSQIFTENDTLTIDPNLEIDSSFADPSSYTIELSAGVGNSPESNSVPEPASVALLGTALAGLGLIRRRRRAKGASTGNRMNP